ncbi:hypothetical protein SAMN04488097_4027 [Epilithonimonas lactis]|nr:hypothetical protein SAMN04488097_4027 [Epilithonimonas lactis]
MIHGLCNFMDNNSTIIFVKIDLILRLLIYKYYFVISRKVPNRVIGYIRYIHY